MRTQNRLGVIHAYPSAWLIQALKLDGWQVVLVGDFARRDVLQGVDDVIQVSLTDDEQVISAVTAYHAAKPFDAILPVYEGATVLTATISERLGLPCYKAAAAHASRNKFLAATLWTLQGVPTPKTYPLLEVDQAWPVVQAHFGGDAVLKLCDSMNSQGVVRLRTEEDCRRHLATLQGMLTSESADASVDRNRFAYGRSPVPFILQEYCEGPEVGIDLVIDDDESHILGVFEKALNGGPCFAETLSVWPTSLGAEAESVLGQLAIDAVRALGVTTTIAHVEIRLTPQGPRVLEAGLRPGGAYTVMASEQLTGINAYRWLAASLTGEPKPRSGSTLTAMLYGGIPYASSGRLVGVDGMEIFKRIPGLIDLQILNKPGDVVHALPRSAQPHLCYYLISGADRDSVMHLHEEIQASVRIQIDEEIPA